MSASKSIPMKQGTFRCQGTKVKGRTMLTLDLLIHYITLDTVLVKSWDSPCVLAFTCIKDNEEC